MVGSAQAAMIGPTAYTGPWPIPADFNLDGIVNVADLGILATNYGKAGKGWREGDSSGDQLVNVADQGLLSTHYGQSMPLPVPMTSTMPIVSPPDPVDQGPANPWPWLYAAGNPTDTDIEQLTNPIVADCYFEAVLAGMAYTRPLDVRDFVCMAPDGQHVDVRWWGMGEITRVNATNSNPLTTLQGPWGWYARKAFAHMRTATVGNPASGSNSFASLSWGSSSEVMGRIGYSNVIAYANWDSVNLNKVLQGGGVVVANTRPTQPANSPVVASHAYTVLFIVLGPNPNGLDPTDQFTLRNPWGLGNDVLTLNRTQMNLHFSSFSCGFAPIKKR